MLRINLAILILLSGMASALSGQVPDMVGEQVRITWPHDEVEGTLIRATPSRLWVATGRAGEILEVDVRELRGLDVWRRRSRTAEVLKGVAMGGAIGAAAGALAGPILSPDCIGFFNDMLEGSRATGCVGALTDGKRYRDGALFGVATGVGIGLIAGLFSSAPRWEGIPLVETPSGTLIAWNLIGTRNMSVSVTVPMPRL